MTTRPSKGINKTDTPSTSDIISLIERNLGHYQKESELEQQLQDHSLSQSVPQEDSSVKTPEQLATIYQGSDQSELTTLDKSGERQNELKEKYELSGEGQGLTAGSHEEPQILPYPWNQLTTEQANAWRELVQPKESATEISSVVDRIPTPDKRLNQFSYSPPNYSNTLYQKIDEFLWMLLEYGMLNQSSIAYNYCQKLLEELRSQAI